MDDTGKLQSSVRDLSILEKELWDAFVAAEKTYTPPILNFVAALKCATNLYKKRLLKLHEFYPVILLFIPISGFSFVVSQKIWFLIPYTISIFWTLYALNRYITQFTLDKTKNINFIKHGFGVANLSLFILGVTEVAKAAGANFSESELASIIKLVKSSQDHADIAYGFSDLAKKSIWGGILSLPYFFASHFNDVNVFAEKFWNLISRKNTAIFSLILFVIALLVWCYGLFFAEAKIKKRKRKYLLMLNIIHEGLVAK